VLPVNPTPKVCLVSELIKYKGNCNNVVCDPLEKHTHTHTHVLMFHCWLSNQYLSSHKKRNTHTHTCTWEQQRVTHTHVSLTVQEFYWRNEIVNDTH